MLHETQPLQTPVHTALENTQPVGIAQQAPQTSQETQEIIIQNESAPLPEWILTWARCDEEPLPDNPASELDNTREAPFVAPSRPEESGWGLAQQLPSNPIQSLEELILEGKLDDAKNLVVQHKNEPEFRKSAGIALRKHLSIDEASTPLWEAYEMLNKE